AEPVELANQVTAAGIFDRGLRKQPVDAALAGLRRSYRGRLRHDCGRSENNEERHDQHRSKWFHVFRLRDRLRTVICADAYSTMRIAFVSPAGRAEVLALEQA